MDKREVLNILHDTNRLKEEKIDTLLYAIFNIDDWKWLQDLCIKIASSTDEDLSGLAITGIGHIARMYNTLEMEIVVPFLENIVQENNNLSGRATDALDDIEIFIN